MSASLNKVFLIGTLGRNPELKVTQTNMQVVTLSVATTEYHKGKENTTEWHNVVAFDKLAMQCQDYMRKGTLVYVEGRLHTNKWTDKHGKDRLTVEVVAYSIQVLSGWKDEKPKREAEPEPPAAQPEAPQARNKLDNGDDIPF